MSGRRLSRYGPDDCTRCWAAFSFAVATISMVRVIFFVEADALDPLPDDLWLLGHGSSVRSPLYGLGSLAASSASLAGGGGVGASAPFHGCA